MLLSGFGRGCHHSNHPLAGWQLTPLQWPRLSWGPLLVVIWNHIRQMEFFFFFFHFLIYNLFSSRLLILSVYWKNHGCQTFVLVIITWEHLVTPVGFLLNQKFRLERLGIFMGSQAPKGCWIRRSSDHTLRGPHTMSHHWPLGAGGDGLLLQGLSRNSQVMSWPCGRKSQKGGGSELCFCVQTVLGSNPTSTTHQLCILSFLICKMGNRHFPWEHGEE